MLVRRPRHLTRAILDDLRLHYLTWERVLPGLLIIVTLPCFTSAFSSLKVMIPVMHPFSWDPAFAQWDRLLHGGTDPWRILQPLLAQPLVTTGVNALYNIWFFILFIFVFWQAFSMADRRLRQRFFLSFVLCWAIIGTVAGTVFSSAGPVYFDRVTGTQGPYGELMAYLQAAAAHYPVWALDVQEMLWRGYADGGAGLGGGISAMPSMHLSMAGLFVLVAAQVRHWLGWVFAIYALGILVGSVHLGWHYAIDGYVPFLMTWAIWRLTARLVPPGT